MTARTPSQRGTSNRRRGLDAERAVANYLQAMGFPDARRAVAAGWTTNTTNNPDPGDIAGVPGCVISVKNTRVDEIARWMRELDEMAPKDTLALRLLVIRRPYKRDPGQWRCIVRHSTLGGLAKGLGTYYPFPVEMAFGDAVTMLIDAGYREAS